MRKAVIYVEGGGDEEATLRQVRAGFRDLFREFGQWHARPEVRPCGSRNSTYRDFMTGIRTHPDAFVILLVDSEGPVGLSPRAHLSQGDGWNLSTANDDHIHLMVQAVEAWLIADPDALEEHFGPQFDRNALSRRPDPESIPKEELKSSLATAARDTPKRGYNEIRDCPKILALVDPRVLRAKCKACRDLFDVISSITRTPQLP